MKDLRPVISNANTLIKSAHDRLLADPVALLIPRKSMRIYVLCSLNRNEPAVHRSLFCSLSLSSLSAETIFHKALLAMFRGMTSA